MRRPLPKPRALSALLALVVVSLVGCGSQSPGAGLAVEISFDPGMPRSARDRAERVEIHVIASCEAITLGTRDVDPIASTYALRTGGGGAPLPERLEPGSYGLYAVAQDRNCGVVAAGCADVTIVAADRSGLSVTLTPFPADGCLAGLFCNLVTGDCEHGGDGSGGAGGAGGVTMDCTVALDETLCREGTALGLCRGGACCTGCWDGTSCRAGSQNLSCGTNGESCEVCECANDACVAGDCAPMTVITDVDMGDMHGCALTNDGQLWCWGSHEEGELGIGAAQGSSCDGDLCFPEPVELTVLVQGSAPVWSQVSAGDEVTCAILASDSSLWCWGDNRDGAMGAPSHVSGDDEPVLVSAAPHRKVDNEGDNGCATRIDGSLWCWGEDGRGQVGLGPRFPSDVYGPREMPYASDWEDFSVGDRYVCALRQAPGERPLWCWGNNDHGQFGTGETGRTNHPADTGLEASVIEAGNETTCALDASGAGWCWGDNDYGQVGGGPSLGNTVRTPVPIFGALSFGGVSLGDDFACGVTTSGALYCWGRNRYGQLGKPYSETREVDVPTRVGTDASWSSVSAGGDSACGVRANGTLWCWGRNDDGQLGTGDRETRTFPTRVCF